MHRLKSFQVKHLPVAIANATNFDVYSCRELSQKPLSTGFGQLIKWNGSTTAKLVDVFGHFVISDVEMTSNGTFAWRNDAYYDDEFNFPTQHDHAIGELTIDSIYSYLSQTGFSIFLHFRRKRHIMPNFSLSVSISLKLVQQMRRTERSDHTDPGSEAAPSPTSENTVAIENWVRMSASARSHINEYVHDEEAKVWSSRTNGCQRCVNADQECVVNFSLYDDEDGDTRYRVVKCDSCRQAARGSARCNPNFSQSIRDLYRRELSRSYRPTSSAPSIPRTVTPQSVERYRNDSATYLRQIIQMATRNNDEDIRFCARMLHRISNDFLAEHDSDPINIDYDIEASGSRSIPSSPSRRRRR